MKSFFIFILPLAATILTAPVAPASVVPDTYRNIIRQQQQATGVVWDMPVAPQGNGPAALLAEQKGALFQLWTINQNTALDYLLDQKLVGAYLPSGAITIRTLDSYKGIPRIRADQSFAVDFNIANLLTGENLPTFATRVLAEHHLAPDLEGTNNITTAQAISGTPHASGFISNNGTTTVNYAATSITSPNPSKARGEEHFVLHALGDGKYLQTQIAAARLQVWPVADGKIIGIKDGDTVRGDVPVLTLPLNDLYPSSYTRLLITSSGPVLGSTGAVITSSELVLDQELPLSKTLAVRDYGNIFDSDGPYRIDLLTTTPFGTEELATVSFNVDRTIRVNAMQVDAEIVNK